MNANFSDFELVKAFYEPVNTIFFLLKPEDRPKKEKITGVSHKLEFLLQLFTSTLPPETLRSRVAFKNSLPTENFLLLLLRKSEVS